VEIYSPKSLGLSNCKAIALKFRLHSIQFTSEAFETDRKMSSSMKVIQVIKVKADVAALLIFFLSFVAFATFPQKLLR
jgi:hypothetical protein